MALKLDFSIQFFLQYARLLEYNLLLFPMTIYYYITIIIIK